VAHIIQTTNEVELRRAFDGHCCQIFSFSVSKGLLKFKICTLSCIKKLKDIFTHFEIAKHSGLGREEFFLDEFTLVNSVDQNELRSKARVLKNVKILIFDLTMG